MEKRLDAIFEDYKLFVKERDIEMYNGLKDFELKSKNDKYYSLVIGDKFLELYDKDERLAVKEFSSLLGFIRGYNKGVEHAKG